MLEISVKNTFRGSYCNHRLNFAVDQCYSYKSNKLFSVFLCHSLRELISNWLT